MLLQWTGALLCLMLALQPTLVLSDYDISLPVWNENNNMRAKISLGSKQVYVNLDLTQTYMVICCKPNRGLFEIIHGFLSNPFFQINEYTCPGTPTNALSGDIKLASMGVISMQHFVVEYPQCSEGSLGLSKKSVFIDFLPINAHVIQIEVENKQGTPDNKIKVSFGAELADTQKSELSLVLSSSHEEYWNAQTTSIMLGPMTVDLKPEVVFVSRGSNILIPGPVYQKILAYFPSNLSCKVSGDKLMCLCESGIPVYFPHFIINLHNNQKLQILPQMYMSIESNICTVLVQASPNKYWHLNVGFFVDRVFYLDRRQSHITIVNKETKANPTSALISLPIPLILNCAVVLLMCIFASLVVIEIIKRVTGMSEQGGDTVPHYIMRRDIQ